MQPEMIDTADFQVLVPNSKEKIEKDIKIKIVKVKELVEGRKYDNINIVKSEMDV